VLIAIATDIADTSATTREQATEAIRSAHTTLYALALRGPDATSGIDTMLETSIRSAVMSEGAAQSGGRFESIARGVAFPDAMLSVAHELLHQYKVTYDVPTSVKANGRVSVTSRRAGVKVRAPTRIAE
jgi:hypothetical protein